ncbi:MAG: aldehyde dehydrogenase family protein, partial [Rhizobiales bacterium]|nr:aldehyde dehydrogenase family protein [Rhizobacter sp.]
MLKIHNPATGALIAEVPAATPEIVAERAAAARAAQPAWAALPLRERMEVLQRFRVALAAETESLAAALTAEVGKPIRQSRSEVNGLLPRIDFFLAEAEATIGAQQLHDEGGTREVISFDPLGVIANISAWNYPYFVGGNVFVPALL